MRERPTASELEHFLLQTKDRLYRFIYRMVLRPDVAQDLFQETWLKVVQNIHQYDPGKPFEPWLFRIARNTAINYLRKPFHRREQTVEVLHESVAGLPGSQDRFPDEDRLRQGLQRLSVKYRSILHLRFLEEFSIEEVAGILGIRPGTVKSRTNRAMRQLKKVMEQLS